MRNPRDWVVVIGLRTKQGGGAARRRAWSIFDGSAYSAEGLLLLLGSGEAGSSSAGGGQAVTGRVLRPKVRQCCVGRCADAHGFTEVGPPRQAYDVAAEGVSWQLLGVGKECGPRPALVDAAVPGLHDGDGIEVVVHRLKASRVASLRGSRSSPERYGEVVNFDGFAVPRRAINAQRRPLDDAATGAVAGTFRLGVALLRKQRGVEEESDWREEPA